MFSPDIIGIKMFSPDIVGIKNIQRDRVSLYLYFLLVRILDYGSRCHMIQMCWKLKR